VTPLESKLSELLDDCEGLLEPYFITKQKWVIINETQKRLDTIFDLKSSLSISYGKAINKIRELESYKNTEIVFGRDSVFSDAAFTAGYKKKGVKSTIDPCKIIGKIQN